MVDPMTSSAPARSASLRPAVPTVASAAMISRFLLSSQKLVNPNRTMFERIFLRGEVQAEVTKSMGLTNTDYQQMLRVLTASTQ